MIHVAALCTLPTILHDFYMAAIRVDILNWNVYDLLTGYVIIAFSPKEFLEIVKWAALFLKVSKNLGKLG